MSRRAKRRAAHRTAPNERQTAMVERGDALARRGGSSFGLLVGAGVAVAVAALYLRTAAHDLVLGDTPELSGAAIVLGVAHPPGYPLWTIVGHLFTLLPVDTLVFRLSLFSIVSSVAALLVVFTFAHRVSRSLLGASAACLALATAPLYWRWSIVPEVFALNSLLVALAMWLTWEWHRSPARTSLLAGGAFAFGLGMANHQTIALLVPAILYVLWTDHTVLVRRPRTIVFAALALVAGLLPYAYVPWAASRATAWNWSDIANLSDLLDHLLRRGYGTTSLIGDPRFQGGAPFERMLDWARSFTVPEIVLVALGAVQAYRANRQLAWYVGLAALFSGPIFVLVSNANAADESVRVILERFFVMSHVVLAPLEALGVIAGQLFAARAATAQQRARLAVGGAAIVGALATAWLSFGAIDISDDHVARRYAMDLLRTAPQGSLLLAGGDPVVFPIQYLQTIESVRPDVTLVTLPLTPADWYVRQLRRTHPDLVLNAPRYGNAPGTMRDLIQPNIGRPVMLKAELLDNTTADLYWVYHHGLLLRLRPLSETVDLGSFADDNTALMSTYAPPSTAHANVRPWEHLVLDDYAFVPFNVGHEYELAQRSADARSWYERALAIDPDLEQARAALARLPR